MNKTTLDYLIRKSDNRRDMRDYRDYRDSRDMRRGRRDYNDYRDYRDYRGRGNVDFEGSMDFRDDEYDSAYDGRDSEALRLSKSDIHRWKQMLENEDGTHGAHYDMQQTVDIAEKIGINFGKDGFNEKEFCMAVNMMYSDYCKVAKKYVSPDRELHFFAEMAKAFLCDVDAPDPSEKLALYFNCIVDA